MEDIGLDNSTVVILGIIKTRWIAFNIGSATVKPRRIMFCPSCGSTEILYGFSYGEIHGVSHTQIRCLKCKKDSTVTDGWTQLARRWPKGKF